MTGPEPLQLDHPPRVVPIALLLGLLFGLGGLGSTALAVVLPDAARALDITVPQSTWLISLYALTMAVSTPVYGRLVDVAGVRVPLAAGVGLMTLGALLAAAASSFPLMVVARLLQGLGTGVGPTLAVAVIGTRFHGTERTRGLAIAAGTAGAIGAAGPLIGGAVESVLTWRGTTALPALGLIVLVVLWRRVQGPAAGSRFDVPGAVLVALAGGGLIMLLQSPSSGGPVAAVGVALAGLMGPLVIVRSRRADHAFLPASVLLDLRIVRTCLVAGTIPASWFALLVAVPTRLADKGWSPALVGLALLPSAAVAVLTPRVTPAIAARVGPVGSLALAAAMATSALVIAGFGVRFGWAVPMVAAVAVVSAAFSLGQPPLFSIVGDLAREDVRGVAMGFATLVFLTCGSAGSAVVGGLTAIVGVHGGLWVLAGFCAGGLTIALHEAAVATRRGRREATA